MQTIRIYFRLAMLVCFSLGTSVANGLVHSATCESHSVFIPRSITHDPTFELALSNYDFYHPQSIEDCDWFDLYLTPFYQRSMRSCRTARYFFPNDKDTLLFAQDGSGDVGTLWFNLMSAQGQSYRSKVSIAPRRTTYGVNIALYKDLEYLCSGLWGSIVFTPMHAKHDLRLTEFDRTGGDGIVSGVANAIDALNNPEMLNGKFNRCATGKTGVDDIQIKFGYNTFYNDGQTHKGMYLVGTIPTGTKPCNDYIFDPRVGTRNGALGFGINTDHDLCTNDQRSVHLMFDLKYRYLFAATECRSFDLCANGEWSRFLQVVPSDDRSNSEFGINNCFTQKVKVTPQSQIDFWTAIHWRYCNWDWEFGYTLWWRQEEDIRFKNCNCCTMGIYDITADAQRQNAQNEQIRQPISASTATISQSVVQPNQAVSDLTFTQVGPLNPASGAHPRAITNKFYFAGAYETVCLGEPMFFGLGGSIESSVDKNALDQWAIWGKWGINF